MVEEASRMVGDQDRLTLRFNDIANLLSEAEVQARRSRSRLIKRLHIDRAIALRDDLTGLIPSKFVEAIDDDRIVVETTGDKVGVVNGLAVYAVGDRSFGKPLRITATTFAGRAGIVNVERESRLAGRIHDKGVLILHGWLGRTYGQQGPLALTVNLTIEQNYGHIDGDSASAAELYAVVSSLSGVPLRQDIAVTGSVNQLGEVQAIGGVNEKIEGFFDVCRRRKLTGRQGVAIPVPNARHLMLRDDIQRAVAKGRFHIYLVGTIDQGLELLSGMAPARIHERALERLRRFQDMDRRRPAGRSG
jgi:predicted ATP-dependent protease